MSESIDLRTFVKPDRRHRIVIPKKMWEKLKLKEGCELIFSVYKGKILMEKV